MSDEAQRPDAARVAGDQRRQRQQQRELAELGRLELEERELDPAARPARRETEQEDDGDEPDRADVERPFEAAQALDVEEREEAERDHADAEVDLLADHELVAPGARADHVEPERGDAGEREEHQPVEPPHAPEGADAPACGGARACAPARRGSGRWTSVDSSTTVPRFGFLTLKTLE